MVYAGCFQWLPSQFRVTEHTPLRRGWYTSFCSMQRLARDDGQKSAMEGVLRNVVGWARVRNHGFFKPENPASRLIGEMPVPGPATLLGRAQRAGTGKNLS